MSTTNFASVRAGPGHAKPLSTAYQDPDAAGVTTFRVSSKDRTFVDEVWYKGWNIRLADWLHLSNPDDPSRPIVAQVFKVWLSDEP
jgi:chromatin structure-remodeling complex subunit RSC1/2